MNKRDARKWVRQHWAAWMSGQDPPQESPLEAAIVWEEETEKIIRCFCRDVAQAIEAQRAGTTKIGPVADESAVPEGNAPKGEPR